MTQNQGRAVASADHAVRGRAEGFMQVCHGKTAPLRRIAAGMGGKDGLQRFTAIGTALGRAPYPPDRGDGFVRFRRDGAWQTARTLAIRPMLGLTRGQRNWGCVFRFGLVKGRQMEFALIPARMTNTVTSARPVDPINPAI